MSGNRNKTKAAKKATTTKEQVDILAAAQEPVTTAVQEPTPEPAQETPPVQQDKAVATMAATETLREGVYRVYGKPLSGVSVKANKNVRAYAVGLVLGAAGLTPKEWPRFVNLLDIASKDDGFIAGVLAKDKEGKPVVREKGQPYCELKHHHVFGGKKCGGEQYADTMEAIKLLRGPFGLELVTAMGRETGVNVPVERLDAYLAELEPTI